MYLYCDCLREQSSSANNNIAKKGTFRQYTEDIGLSENGCVPGLHCDESKWTIDICLGSAFEGGPLEFSVDSVYVCIQKRQKRTAKIDEFAMINIFNGVRNLNSVFVCYY